MTKRWVREHKREHYYKKAKKAGYRSRSAYKLIQINDRYNLISKGDVVIDLGAAPGGWSQVAQEIVGPEGKVLAVDIQRMEPLSGVILIRGDMTKQETVDKILAEVSDVDVILSDMSPSISGHYSMDQARSIDLAEKALLVAEQTLKHKGNFVVKVFQGELFSDFFQKIKARFTFVKGHSPKASRKSSSEIYVVGKGFRAR
ncbi:MAG: RlmE family RNA methyltransferase [Thermoplasmata archaeon]|nr:MAG: RlmE family RNA methyltransferase [Thermoplasmata archaeon]